jgi:hypothetical protein
MSGGVEGLWGATPLSPIQSAIARQRAIRENSVHSWMKNQHGFESQSIFEWRGFPVLKKSSSFPAMQTRLGRGQAV